MDKNTGKTVGVSNLKPWKPGQSGNYKGRPKGTRNWSSIIQRMLADKDFADAVINNKPAWWRTLPNKNMAEIIASAMLIRAAQGDVACANWVRVTAYGNTGKYVSEQKEELVFSPAPRLKATLPRELIKEMATNP